MNVGHICWHFTKIDFIVRCVWTSISFILSLINNNHAPHFRYSAVSHPQKIFRRNLRERRVQRDGDTRNYWSVCVSNDNIHEWTGTNTLIFAYIFIKCLFSNQKILHQATYKFNMWPMCWWKLQFMLNGLNIYSALFFGILFWNFPNELKAKLLATLISFENTEYLCDSYKNIMKAVRFGL